jgi:hypothetical protein
MLSQLYSNPPAVAASQKVYPEGAAAASSSSHNFHKAHKALSNMDSTGSPEQRCCGQQADAKKGQ